MSNLPQSQELSPFAQTVEAALKSYQDPYKLGAESPLAAPYLLADYLDPQAVSAEERGKTLQRLLADAVQAFSGDDCTRYQTIIRERYFLNMREDAIREHVVLSKGAYHKYRKQAIEALAGILITRLHPSLLLEAPPQVAQGKLFGAQRALQPYLQELAANKMVAITGSGGVGKTTLGSQLAHSWEKKSTFWFTIRPGLNDHLNSLLFVFGYFLKTLGEPLLWQEILAQPRDFETIRATAIVRQILQNLGQRQVKPLLCFDEINALQSAEHGEHEQIRAFIEDLRDDAPILLLGQQVLLNAHTFHALEDLSLNEMQQMLQAATIRLNADANHFIYAYTHGNPRLIELFITLWHDERLAAPKTADDESIAALFQQAQSIPPLEFFLHRIVRHLDRVECALLKALSVFRTPAPAELWQNKTTGWALNRLVQRHLMSVNQGGGVGILPAYRIVVYHLLTNEDRQQLHLSAAQIRAARAAYTSAAYHWIQAEQAEIALVQWRQYEQVEISQGQARNAQQLFRDLDTSKLSTKARQLHRLICATLAQLVGNPTQALQDIHSMLQAAPVLTIDAYKLEGEIKNDQRRFSEAKAVFNDALKIAEGVVETRVALLHKGVGWAYFRESDLESAWRETQFARYEVENFQGVIEEERCNYQAAEQLFHVALTLAQAINYKDGMAKTANNLSKLLAKQGRFPEARQFQIMADQYYKTIGKLSAICGAKINWALMHNLAGEYAQAVNVLDEVYELIGVYEIKLSPFQTALIHLGKGEAYFGMANLAQAELHTQQALATEDDAIMPDGYRLLGEILRERNDLVRSEQFLRQSIHLLDVQPDLYTSGYAWRALARTCAKARKMQEAKIAKAKALELFETIKLSYEIERTVESLYHV